ncbi:MAG: type II toxin-antitoxin system RelE/ParE family toxin [Pusillimonas sp.]
MTRKQVVLRDLARQDVDDVLAHYLSKGSPAAAQDFINKLEQAFAHISRHPTTGSPRYAHELDLPELRFWQTKRHPYLIFYIDQADHIDVWRILHGSRDIPRWMQQDSQK